MSQPLIQRVLSCSAAAAVRAGAKIREVMRSGQLGIVAKGENDLQTEADRQAQRIIIGNLRASFPEVAVIGEEELSAADEQLLEGQRVQPEASVLQQQCPQQWNDVAASDICVWVDPLDGTSEFKDNLLDHVTVLIGVAVREKAVAGVIYQPYFGYEKSSDTPDSLGRLVWGLEGLGVFGLDSSNRQAPPGNIVATTRSHSNQVVNDAVAACEPTEVLRVGGCGHKVLLLIEGKAHAYVFASPGCKKWDTCAPEAVLRCLGGQLTDIHGRPLLYGPKQPKPNSSGVLATLMADKHGSYLSKMPQSVLQALP